MLILDQNPKELLPLPVARSRRGERDRFHILEQWAAPIGEIDRRQRGRRTGLRGAERDAEQRHQDKKGAVPLRTSIFNSPKVN